MSLDNVENISEEIIKLEKLITELHTKREFLLNDKVSNSPAGRMAILLHKCTCHSNHTDQCGWYYEIDTNGVHDWNGSTHKYYWNKACLLIHAGYDYDQVDKFFSILKG